MNPLKALNEYGQVVWLDFLARRFIADGSLKRLVDEDGLTGVTSNPSIFEKAILHSRDYDGSLKDPEAQGDRDAQSLFATLDSTPDTTPATGPHPVHHQADGRSVSAR